MAYGKLAEGDRCYDAADDAGIYYEDLNEVQDQIATAHGPLPVTCPAAAAWYDTSGATTWNYRAALGYNAWQNTGSTGALYLPLGTLRTGQKITALSVVIRGSTTGGSILWQKQHCSASVAAPTTVATFPSNPWNTSGAFAARAATISGTTETIVGQWDHYITFTPPAVTHYVLGAYYTAQFGN